MRRAKSRLWLILLVQQVRGLLEAPISRSNHHHRNQISERGTFVETNVFNIATYITGSGYFINVSLGTPPQQLTLLISTESADTYVNSATSNLCQLAEPDVFCPGGTFDTNKSSTYRILDESGFDLGEVSGPHAADEFAIGNTAISELEFDVAQIVSTGTRSSVGRLGLGNSVEERVSDGTLYTNILDVMKHTGVINSRLYSMYMGGSDGSSGSLLFGAVDNSKYSGPLTTLNFLPSAWGAQTSVQDPILTITSSKINVSGHIHDLWTGGADGVKAYNDTNSLPVYLGTAAQFWTLPPTQFNNLMRLLPFVDAKTSVCRCADLPADDSIQLTFGGKAELSFSLNQLSVQLFDASTRTPIHLTDGTSACYLMIANSTGSNAVFDLGQGLLKNMYVVYDLDNGQASIAQAIVDSEGSQEPDVVEVAAGRDGVAKAARSVVTAPSNSWPIQSPPPGVFGSHSVSTLKTPIGTATGKAAIPLAAQTINPDMPPSAIPGSEWNTAFGQPSPDAPTSARTNGGGDRLTNDGWVVIAHFSILSIAVLAVL